MEISDYIRLFRRWLWLIVLAAIIGGGLNYYLQREAQTVYSAQSKVLIGRYVTDPDPSSSEIRLAQDLLQVYQQILQRTDVLQAVILKLQLDITTGQLKSRISSAQVGDTSILGISVRDTNPQRAMMIANELANQLIENSPSTLTQDQQDRIDLSFDQIEELRVLQQDTQHQIDILDEAIAKTNDVDEVFALSNQRSGLLAQYSEISATIASFSGLITALEDPINSIQMFELASSVYISEQPNPIMAIVIGVTAGAVAVGALLLLREYTNTNLREIEQVRATLDIPLIGECSRHGSRFRRGRNRQLIFNYDTSLLLLEEFRAIRANLTAMISNQNQKLLVVTSTYEQEGKSWVSANLAITLAMAGHRVCLVDADLRRPSLHRIFNIDDHEIDADSNLNITSIYRPRSLKVPTSEEKKQYGSGIIGLAHAVGGRRRNENKSETEAIDLDKSLFWTGMEDLWLVTSGFHALNSNEILGSQSMQEYTQWLVEEKHFDFVIFDSPPIYYVTDSSVLASNVNAAVLFVIRKNRVAENIALTMMDRLKHARVDVIGFVMNFSKPQANLYYTKPPRMTG